MAIPTSTQAWILTGNNRGFDSLELQEAPLPPLGSHDVLVRLHYASLNYRDVRMATGTGISVRKPDVVPGSDGAGTVVAVGSAVTHFQPGSNVLTLFAALGPIPTQHDLETLPLGGALDGVFRQFGVFQESSLISMPRTLSFREASTLPCAGVTAWNALFGLTSHTVKPGDTVLTQGSGGVATFAIQFAKAAGAKVIATTSSEAKATFLRGLSYPPDEIINYRMEPQWGVKAKTLTAGGFGVDFVVDVGGHATLAQSLKAVKLGGVISMVGFASGEVDEKPDMLQVFKNFCILRGLLVGQRSHFEDLIKAVDGCGIKPALDEKMWDLDELKDAYQYMWDANHLGKVTIQITPHDEKGKVASEE